MKTIISKTILICTLFNLLSFLAFSQKTDFRDNFTGKYICTKRIIHLADTSYYSGNNYLSVIKSLNSINVVHVIDSSLFPGFWNRPMALNLDSTFHDTGYSSIDYWGRFKPNDSIFVHRQEGLPFLVEYFGHKIITGIDNNNIDNNILKLFPNPAKEQATLYFSENGITNITIYNIFGREVYCHNVQNSKSANYETINVSDWAKGMYIVKASTNEGIKTSKLLVE
jgi:hypothetical protein